MGLTDLKLLPTPKFVSGADQNGSYQWKDFSKRIFTSKADWQKLTEVFAYYTKKAYDFDVESGEGGIEMLFDFNLENGHYRIDTMGDGVKLYAADANGMGYAIATLIQIIEDGKVPVLTIEDYPDCEYRTLMVDLGSRWHTFDLVLNYVDLCFLYKLSFMHIHFIEIPSYTLPSDVFPDIFTKDRHYTKEQIRELNEYAAARNITLIPEFEVPSHASAMIAAYPELFGCTDPEEKITICPCRQGLYDNLDKLVTEICEMFPNSPYIHIGGDEAGFPRCPECPLGKKYLEDNHLPTPGALYTHFVANMTKIIFAHHRTPIVWEGFPKEGDDAISRDVIVTGWESYYHYPTDLLDEGFKVINASWQPLYINRTMNWTPYDILKWDIYTWQNWWEKSPAHLNPFRARPTDNVWGAQLCAWGSTYDRAMPIVKENLIALSERTWSVKRVAEDAEFKVRLEKLLGIVNAVVRE